MSKDVQRYNSLKEATRLSLQQAKGFDGLVDDILTRVVIDTIRRYQTKLNVGIQDSVSDLLDTFKQKVTQAIFDTSNSWKVTNHDPFIFPRGCRFCYTRGSSTIIVIEQDPQVRTLSLSAGLFEGRLRRTEPKRVALALPFVVFLVHFRDNNFTGLYSGWKTRPLRSMSDMLGRPVLPNVHDNLAVCTGAINGLVGGSIVDQTEAVLNHYWSSTFNTDLSDYWCSKHQLSHHFRSVKSWSDASEDDPTFILQVEIESSGRTMDRLIEMMTMQEETPDESAFRHNFSEEIDKCVESLFSKILRYLKKTKFDKHYPKDIKSGLQETLSNATSELTDLICALDQEVSAFSDHLKEGNKKEIIAGSGVWKDYSS
jgi:hypothetical protein